MRFFESVKKCLWEDTFKHVSSNMKDSDIPEEKYGKDYVEFINELLHYVKIGIQSAPAKYIDHRYDEYHLAVLFEYHSRLYIIRFSNWTLRYNIYLCPEQQYFYEYGSIYFNTKCIQHSLDNIYRPEGLLMVSFPNYNKFKEGDIVMLNSSALKKYYYRSSKGKVFIIEKVRFHSHYIDYDTVSLDNDKTSYAYSESNLIKIKNGL